METFPVEEVRAVLLALGEDAPLVERLQWGRPGSSTERYLFNGSGRGKADRVLTVGPRVYRALGAWANRSGRPAIGQPAVPAHYGGVRPMSFRSVLERVGGAYASS